MKEFKLNRKVLKLIFAVSISMINLKAYELISHRGHSNYPENSKESIIAALKNGYVGVEIDIQPLKKVEGTQSFALLHDLIIKREIVSSYKNFLKNSESRLAEA